MSSPNKHISLHKSALQTTILWMSTSRLVIDYFLLVDHLSSRLLVDHLLVNGSLTESCPFACGDLALNSLGPPESTTQTASWLVQQFCMTYDRDRPTDRPTDRPRYSVRNSRLHLYVVLLCGLIIIRLRLAFGIKWSNRKWTSTTRSHCKTSRIYTYRHRYIYS